jgi:hypothetical protein
MTELKQAERQQAWSAKGLRRHFSFIAKISPFFRRKRMEKFLRLFHPTHETRILDIGGLPRFWADAKIEAQVTIINLRPLDEYEASFLTPNQSFVLADATCLPWADGSFDLVFSNSLIEHLGTREKQEAFARECVRVADAHWIQTPAKEFPVEPHFLGLFVHWFPKRIRKHLARWCTPWGLLARPKPEIMDQVMDELRLLTCKEFRSLFPGSQIIKERALGLPKSYVAVKLPGPKATRL